MKSTYNFCLAAVLLCAQLFSLECYAVVEVDSAFTGFEKPAPDLDKIQQLKTGLNSLEALAAKGDIQSMIDKIEAGLQKNQDKTFLARIAPELEQLKRIKKTGQLTGIDIVLERMASKPETIDLDRLQRWVETDLKSLSDPKKDHLISRIATMRVNQNFFLQMQKRDCGNKVDLSLKLPKKKNQTDTEWCFAFAVADLISYETQSDVSASHLALTSLRLEPRPDVVSDNIPFVSGVHPFGYIPSALDAAKSEGYCPESAHPSKALLLQNKKHAEFSKLLLEIETFQNAGQQFKEIQDSYCSDIYRRVAKNVLPQVDYSAFNEIFKTSKTNALISRLSQKNCEKVKKQLPAGTKYHCIGDFDKIGVNPLAAISSVLNASKPIAIGMSIDALKDGASPGLEPKTNHAIVIAGKKWNDQKNQCDFLVRNSASSSSTDEWYPAEQVIQTMSHGCFYLPQK